MLAIRMELIPKIHYARFDASHLWQMALLLEDVPNKDLFQLTLTDQVMPQALHRQRWIVRGPVGR